MTEPAERFLVVRLTALGDILHTLPAVAALRAAHPAATIDWVVERTWARVVEASPIVNRVIRFERNSTSGAIKCVRQLRQLHPTCAIDFQGLYKSSVLAMLSGAPRRVGFAFESAREKGAALLYTERVVPTGRHVTELNYSLAERLGALRPAIPEYPLQVPEGGVASVGAKLAELGIGEYVVIGPGGSWRAKRWPPQRFGQLCRGLENRLGLKVIVIHGPGEEELAQAVYGSAAPAKPFVMTTNIEELMALLAGARGVVAADSGPLHLATALGTRVVGLYGPTDPARNGPFGPNAVVVTQASPEEISYKRKLSYSPAMLRITVEEVLDACERCMGPGA